MPFYLAQPLWNFINACLFQYGIAAYDLKIGKYLKGQTDKDEFRRNAKRVLAQDPQADDEATMCCTRCCPGPSALTTLTANLTANLVRNLWTHSVIMCGHFPEGVQTFEKNVDRRRNPRRVVPAADARLGQHQREVGCCTS